MEGRFVAYYRVSTQKQGKSGLGLEAQQSAVRDYLNGGNWELLAEYTEVESGKGSNALDKRPALKEAIAFAKKNKARIIIAKIDRLSRNVHFLTGLMESKIQFVAVDMPEANELTTHIMAAFAQNEAKRISERTKEALAAAKSRGVILGKPENLQKGCTQNKEKALVFASKIKPMIQALQRDGLTQRAMVQRLNDLGIKTAENAEWRLLTLQRVLKRINSVED